MTLCKTCNGRGILPEPFRGVLTCGTCNGARYLEGYAANSGLVPYYVTFGQGSPFRLYCHVVMARNEDIARAWAGKALYGQWSGIYTVPPAGLVMLSGGQPTRLYHASAAHV